ncbi:hypothetical protein HAX54_037437, partial [Datura stramonium]|nr:hypothetical protein [Datura stramonium]
TGEVKMSCETKCKLLCLINPFCNYKKCMKNCHDNDDSISTEEVQVNVAPTSSNGQVDGNLLE